MAFLLISVKSEKIDHGIGFSRLRVLYSGTVGDQEGDQRLREG